MFQKSDAKPLAAATAVAKVQKKKKKMKNTISKANIIMQVAERDCSNFI